MQRIAMRASTLGLLVLFAGCAQKKPPSSISDPIAMDDAVRESVYVAEDSDHDPSDGQYLAYDDPAAAESTIVAGQGVADTPGPRTHTVAKGDTLYGLARVYYEDPRQWRAIYEANRVQLADPNALRVGQQLTIP